MPKLVDVSSGYCVFVIWITHDMLIQAEINNAKAKAKK